MIVDRHSALWSLIFFAAVAAQIVELPPIPEWLNNAIFLASFIIIIVAASMLGILQLHQRATNNQDVVIFGDKVSGHLARIVNYQYKILFVSAVVAFTAGAFIFPPKSNDLGKHMPVLEDGMLSPPSDPTSVVIPLTPARLFEIARTQTRRDAMSHKGSLIHFQGTVLDISEVKERWSEADASYKLVIGIEVAIGSLSQVVPESFANLSFRHFFSFSHESLILKIRLRLIPSFLSPTSSPIYALAWPHTTSTHSAHQEKLPLHGTSSLSP